MYKYLQEKELNKAIEWLVKIVVLSYKLVFSFMCVGSKKYQ